MDMEVFRYSNKLKLNWLIKPECWFSWNTNIRVSSSTLQQLNHSQLTKHNYIITV